MSRNLAILILTILAFGFNGFAQEIEQTQYYLNLPGVNAAFTGLEDYVDTRLSYRQGWNNFGVRNDYTFVSAYGSTNNSSRISLTNNSLRFSDPDGFRSVQQAEKLLRKHGIGGMASSRQFGPYRNNRVQLNYAYHLPVARNLMMSLGVKAGYSNQMIDFSGLTVRDELNDAFYQQIIRSSAGNASKFTLDFGYALYSSKFYFALSSNNLVVTNIFGESTLDLQLQPHVSAQAAWISIPLGASLSFSPAGQVIYSQVYGVAWSATGRFRIKDIVYIGAGYASSSPRVSVLLGLRLDSRFSLNYAFDRYVSDLHNFGVQMHEVTVGLALFNKYRINSKLW